MNEDVPEDWSCEHGTTIYNGKHDPLNFIRPFRTEAQINLWKEGKLPQRDPACPDTTAERLCGPHELGTFLTYDKTVFYHIIF